MGQPTLKEGLNETRPEGNTHTRLPRLHRLWLLGNHGDIICPAVVSTAVVLCAAGGAGACADVGAGAAAGAEVLPVAVAAAAAAAAAQGLTVAVAAAHVAAVVVVVAAAVAATFKPSFLK